MKFIKLWIKLIILINVNNVGFCAAQIPGPVGDFIRHIRSANQPETITYNYTIKLKDKQQQYIDSIKGKASYSGNRFVDSNNVFFTAFNKQYYCKLNHHKRSFTIYDVAVLQKRLHLNMNRNDNNSFSMLLSDSLLLNYGKAIIDTTQKDIYRVTMRFTDKAVSMIQFDIRRLDYKIIGGTIEQEEKDTEGSVTDYVKVYKIFNVQYTADEAVFDLSRIFTIADGKTVVNKKYTHYTLTEVLK